MLKFFQRNLMSEAMSRRIRGVFNAVNFWQIVLYNVLALNSLDFAQLVAKRLLHKGKYFVLDHYIMKTERKVARILCRMCFLHMYSFLHM